MKTLTEITLLCALVVCPLILWLACVGNVFSISGGNVWDILGFFLLPIWLVFACSIWSGDAQ